MCSLLNNVHIIILHCNCKSAYDSCIIYIIILNVSIYVLYTRHKFVFYYKQHIYIYNTCIRLYAIVFIDIYIYIYK